RRASDLSRGRPRQAFCLAPRAGYSLCRLRSCGDTAARRSATAGEWMRGEERREAIARAFASKRARTRSISPFAAAASAATSSSFWTAKAIQLRSWIAFAVQKLDEVAALAAAANGEMERVRALFEANARAIASRRSSPRIHSPAVAERLAAVSPQDLRRQSEYPA